MTTFHGKYVPPTKTQTRRLVSYGKNHTRKLNEIMRELTSLGIGVYSFCSPRPGVMTDKSTKTQLEIIRDKDRPSSFRIKIFIEGCSVNFEACCNSFKKEEAIEIITTWRKEKGYTKPKKKK